mmetsp:Transcript_10696/g.16067  ORF Transcript_10696/g.16067 Transcript_10696/m.16067 type:complete len:854 (-) Transcript_10696:163-2724(-)
MPIFRCPSSCSLSSSDSESSSASCDDYPHPLGFSRYGIDDSDDDSDDVDIDYISPSVIKPVIRLREPTRLPSARENELALQHSLTRSMRQRQFDAELQDVTNDMDRIAALVKCADVIVSDETRTEFLQNQTASLSKLELLANTAAQRNREIDVQLQQDRARMERDREEAAQALKLLIERDQRRADVILAQQKAEEREAIRVSEETAKAVALKEEADRKRQEEETRVRREREEAEAAEAVKQAAEAVKQAEVKAAKQKALQFQTDAQELIQKLDTTRASIAPFEKSKKVSKRRLQIKKVVKGKLNTLQNNAVKVKEVSTEIVQALQATKSDDDSQISADSPEERLGFMYFLDLLASNVIVRASAETFDSSGGEGFPLANCVALVAAKIPELTPILSGHIYTVCPAVIPTLPQVSQDASDDDFMEALGMKKDAKSGDFETFDRFLNRTEGLIAISAAIMCCSYSSTGAIGNDDNHDAKTVLLGGQEGALNWLKRFLELLPLSDTNDNSIMPLITAPVLTSFLTVTGCMLKHKYPAEFTPLWRETIVKRVLPRLDQGAIGAPSALRLKKLVEGVDAFQSLPKGAIPELYVMEASSAPPPAQVNVAPSGFSSGGFANNNNMATPFATSSSSSNNFNSSNTTNPFVNVNAQHTNNATNNPFAPSAAPSGGGGWNSSTTPFSSSTTTMTTTPMTTNNNNVNSNSNPFATMQSQQPNPSPFAVSTTNNNNNFSNPFGTSSNTTATSTTPFGHSNSNSNQFGNNNNNNNSFAPSPFASSQNTANNGRYQGKKGKGKQMCKYFARGICRYGNSCHFSHDMGNGNDHNGNQNNNGGGYSWSIPISGNHGGKSNNNPFGGRGGW